jgi:crotonobetainyl-CoA:carnitine CoA-transferase CaiB-like acyl-CoA transferase
MAGPVLDDADAMTDPQLEARRYFVQIPHEDAGTHRYPGFPYRFQSAELSVRLPPVRLGEHNEYVYKQLLGVSEEEYAELEAEGHIGTEFAPHIR